MALATQVTFGKVAPDNEIKERGEISVLVAAHTLMQEGRRENNPVKLGLAAMLFYTLGYENEVYHTTANLILKEATVMAEKQKNGPALLYLAQIWKSPYIGANNPAKAKELTEKAKKLGVKGLGIGEAGSSFGLLPPHYHRK